MKTFKLIIPNIITSLRLVAAVVLIFFSYGTDFLTYWPFFLVYILGASTDLFDGLLARALHAESKLGNVLDSIADLTFYTVMAVKIFPTMIDKLNYIEWAFVIGVFTLEMAGYVICAIRFKKFSAIHTFGNKILSFIIFAFPFCFIGDIPLLYDLYMYICGTIATYSGVEIVLIHCIAKRYDTRNKSVFFIKRNEATELPQ